MIHWLLYASTIYDELYNDQRYSIQTIFKILNFVEYKTYRNMYHIMPYNLNTVIVLLMSLWLSPIVIPLDWDRVWQPWPIFSSLVFVNLYPVIVFISAVVGWFFVATKDKDMNYSKIKQT